MAWSCVGLGVEQTVYRYGKTRGRESSQSAATPSLMVFDEKMG
jgi:hypothetical protein